VKRKWEEKGYREEEKEREGETTTPTPCSSLSHFSLSQFLFCPSSLPASLFIGYYEEVSIVPPKMYK